MSKKTATIEYRIIQAELQGNARDGFDINNWYELDKKAVVEPYSKRFLLRWARDTFEGMSFAWSEATSRPMSREGIELEDIGTESMVWITYRGHKIGEVQWSSLCKVCGKREHWLGGAHEKCSGRKNIATIGGVTIYTQ